MKEKNAALCRDAATPEIQWNEVAKRFGVRRRSGSGDGAFGRAGVIRTGGDLRAFRKRCRAALATAVQNGGAAGTEAKAALSRRLVSPQSDEGGSET